jgi:hypothetical protein
VNIAKVFVGRDELIHELASCLPSRQGWLADTVGVAGIGKTRLLGRLRETFPATVECLVLQLSMEDFVPGWSPGEPPTLESLSINFNEFCRVLTALADQLADQVHERSFPFHDFLNRIRIARNRERLIHIEVSPRLVVRSRGDPRSPLGDLQNTDIRIDSAVYFQRIDGLRAELLDDFVDRMNRLSERRPVLWTVDSFDAIEGHLVQDWILKLTAQLDGSLVVIARSPSPRDLRAGGSHLLRRPLRPLSADEVDVFIGECLGSRPPPSLSRAIHEFSGGHPQTVVLATELLLQRSPQLGDPEVFAEHLKQLPPDLERRHADMALQIVRTPQDTDLEHAALACSVVRRFDTPLVQALLEGTAPQPRCAELVSRLDGYSFTERCCTPGGHDEYFRLHGFIRGGLLSHLRRTDPNLLRKLHGRAAAHYYALIRNWEEPADPGAGSYAAWYRYEDVRWRAYKLEWLYHQAELARQQVGPDAEAVRQQARLRLVRVFLDAFWWWGCCLDFPFCRHLLEDWERSQFDVRWLQDLHELLESYPPEFTGDPGADWPRVAIILRRIRQSCGISGSPSSRWDQDQRHCRALTDIFCAHTFRRREAATSAERVQFDAQADTFYRQADELFTRNADHWNRAWVHLELAELWAERVQSRRALESWDLAVGLVRQWQFQDEELIARLHRVSADLLWSGRQRPHAVSAYGRAVLHAYLFQNRPHAPDWYTLYFYRGITEHVLGRLAELEGQGRIREAAEHARRLHATLPCAAVASAAAPADEMIERLLTAPDLEALGRLLLPAPPTLDDLDDPRSPFIDTWEETIEVIGPEVTDDLWISADVRGQL